MNRAVMYLIVLGMCRPAHAINLVLIDRDHFEQTRCVIVPELAFSLPAGIGVIMGTCDVDAALAQLAPAPTHPPAPVPPACVMPAEFQDLDWAAVGKEQQFTLHCPRTALRMHIPWPQSRSGQIIYAGPGAAGVSTYAGEIPADARCKGRTVAYNTDTKHASPGQCPIYPGRPPGDVTYFNIQSDCSGPQPCQATVTIQ